MQHKRFSDQIREAVDGSGKSRYRLCVEANIQQSCMSRFMAGRAGLELAAIDRLAEVLGLSVVVVKKPSATQKEG